TGLNKQLFFPDNRQNTGEFGKSVFLHSKYAMIGEPQITLFICINMRMAIGEFIINSILLIQIMMICLAGQLVSV
ncbi:MAG: hypothetical protein OMM_10192, partial [Candidatus Magnetoglobus multicellularis str. Araruama]